MFLLYSRSLGIGGGVVAGGVAAGGVVAGGVVAGGVVAGGVVWVADIANATLIRSTSCVDIAALNFGASVVAGVAGVVGVPGADSGATAGVVGVGVVGVGVVGVGVAGVGVVGVGVAGVGVAGVGVVGADVGATAGVVGASVVAGVVGAVATSASFSRIEAQLTDNACESGVVTCPSPHTISPPKWAVIPMPTATSSDANLEIFNRPGQESPRTSEVMNASAINPTELPIPNQRCKNNSSLSLDASAKNQPLAATQTLASAAIQVQ